MMSESLRDLALVTDAVFRSRLASLQRLAAQESLLRQNLASLDAVRRVGPVKDMQDIEMRALGADILWQGWIMRKRMELNTQLANLLVQKEALRLELQVAFGRSQVAETLWSSEQSRDRKFRSRAQE